MCRDTSPVLRLTQPSLTQRSEGFYFFSSCSFGRSRCFFFIFRVWKVEVYFGSESFLKKISGGFF